MADASYASSDPATRLAAIRAAIQRCLLAEEHYVGSKRHRSAALTALLAAEEKLVAQMEAASPGSATGITPAGSMCSLGELVPAD